MVSHWDWVLYNFRLPVANALRECGCDVTFVCPFGAYTEELRSRGFRCIHWAIERRSLNPVREIGSIVRLTGIYRRLAPDAVHHFTIKPNLYGTIAAGFAKTPAIINTFSGLGYVFSDRHRARWLRVFVLPMLRRALHKPDVITMFENELDRQTFVRLGIVHREQTAVIPGCSVDTLRFSPSRQEVLDPEHRTPVVLMAGRLLWDKGIREFVEAARRLKSQGVESRFCVAGAPDEGNPACVSQDAREAWRRDGTVEFLGHRDDMPDLLRRADVAVLPSYHEGLPRFLLEAAASGLPLVATDIEGCRMVVRDGTNGFLVPPMDAEALAEAILRLLTDSTLRTRFGTESRRIAVQEFSEGKIVQQYLDLYRRIGVLN